MRLSDRANNIEESKTVKFTPLIEKLKEQGKSVINFAVGEPEYLTSENVIEKTKRALDNGNTRYSAVSGLQDLRAAIAGLYPGYESDNVIVSNGSKQSLFLIFQVILNPGDEVIIPVPCWVSFSEQVKMAGGIPVFAQTDHHQLDFDALKSLVTDKTRAIIINSPNNPTGAVYAEKELQKVLALALERKLFVIPMKPTAFLSMTGCRRKVFSEWPRTGIGLSLPAAFQNNTI